MTKPKIKLVDRRREWAETKFRYEFISSRTDFNTLDENTPFAFWRKARQCWRINRQPS